MNAAEASIQRVIERYHRPGAFKRGLKILLPGLPALLEKVNSKERAALAQRIASLLSEREANRKAMRATDVGFNPPPAPAALTMTYRGPLGTIEIDADPEWLRELLPEFSPRSRRGRRIRKLLRLSEEHHAAMWAEREASGLGDLVRERDRIEGELEAAAKEACSLGGHSVADVALQAASLLAVKLSSYYDCKAAPAVLQALLEFADTTEART
jgi:hypothetical protein